MRSQRPILRQGEAAAPSGYFRPAQSLLCVPAGAARCQGALDPTRDSASLGAERGFQFVLEPQQAKPRGLRGQGWGQAKAPSPLVPSFKLGGWGYHPPKAQLLLLVPT